MGRRKSQQQNTGLSQDCLNQDCLNQDCVRAPEKRLQQRRHKPNSSWTNPTNTQHSAQETSGSEVIPVSSAVGSRLLHHREQNHVRPRRTRPGRAPPCPDGGPPVAQGLKQEGGDSDADRDLSDSERLPSPPRPVAPPQLHLRPEVLDPDSLPSCGGATRGHGRAAFSFPDFLPPPFNSWSLTQLAVFYNEEGGAAVRHRPVGPLERYLERLLQLEWQQVQTLRQETGKAEALEAPSHRPSTSTSSRLSCPKSILQCQRAFPLTLLSSVASGSALLPSCSCTLCCLRYSAFSLPCCRSAHSHSHPSRGSHAEGRSTASLPKRSYSESRVPSSASGGQRVSSPVRGNSHLRRMQASGNIRHPAPGAPSKAVSAAWDSGGQREASGPRDCRPVGLRRRRSGSERRRTGSEQRRGGAERRRHGAEMRRSGSESRREGGEWRRGGPAEQEIKPDAVTAIMDNLPTAKHSLREKAARLKQVDFVT